MSPKKHYFKEPVVRVEVSKVRFPKLCPVCGVTASIPSRIILTSGRSKFISGSGRLYRNPHLRGMQKFSQPPEMRNLRIFVCEDHYDTDEGEDRYKSLCFIIDGFTMFLFFFGLLFLGDAFSRGRPLPLWSVAFSVLFAISLFASWIAFRPKALQRAVKIVGFDSSMQNVLLAFENKSYQEAVLQENPMASELISWIIKPGS